MLAVRRMEMEEQRRRQKIRRDATLFSIRRREECGNVRHKHGCHPGVPPYSLGIRIMDNPRTPGPYLCATILPHSTTNTQPIHTKFYFDHSTLLLPLLLRTTGPLITMSNQCQDCHASKSGEYYANYESLTFQVNPTV